MKLKTIDSNVFLRFITKDDERKARKVFRLFEQVSCGEVELFVLEVVIAEVIYILASKKLYSLKVERIRSILAPIIEMKGLKMERKSVVLLALDYMVEKKVDFEDALVVAFMMKKKMQKVYSYDRDFDKFGQIKRVEP